MQNADSIIVLSDGEEDSAFSNNDSVVILEDRTSPGENLNMLEAPDITFFLCLCVS